MSVVLDQPVKRKTLARASVEAVSLALVATVISIYLPTLFGIDVWGTQGTLDIWLQIGAVFTSYASTWLCVTQHRFNYVWGLLSVIMLVFVFGHQHLLGSMLQNIYLIPTLIYGWFIWKSDKNTRPVRHVDPKYGIICLVLTGILYAATFFTLSHFGATLLVWDNIILVGSLLAQWLLDRKIIENWFVWFIVDLIAVVVYAKEGLWVVSIQFFVFLVTAIMGWISWRKSMKTNTGYEDISEEEFDNAVAKGQVLTDYGRNYDSIEYFNKYHNPDKVS